MRIFVSSSFEDLREHRAAAIQVLRQLGHEVLAMEDMVAGSTAPLTKVIDMVDRSEAYVGIFAWRYGYIPKNNAIPASPTVRSIPNVAEAVFGQTSITHYEYLRAKQRDLPIMAFLLDEQYPWPPHRIDGFDTRKADAPANSDKIRELRQLLQLERVVAWYTTPTDLEARVSAAVTMAGLTSQLDLQPATVLSPDLGVASDSSAAFGIKQAIITAGDQQHALKIDLSTTWWSTRLYLIAALANRLTQAQRVLIVDSSTRVVSTNSDDPSLASSQLNAEHFIGQLSTNSILNTIRPKVRALRTFEKWLQNRPLSFNDVDAEINSLLEGWYKAFGDKMGEHNNEIGSKVDLTAELLRRWFGDAMLKQPVHIADLQRASVVDLLRLLDYPNEYVPVLTRDIPANDDEDVIERVNVIDKDALNARLARSYLIELLDRARIV